VVVKPKLPFCALAAESYEENFDELLRIQKADSTNFQWKKLSLNISMVFILFVVKFLAGNVNQPSILGIKACDPIDNLLSATVFVAAIVITIVAVILVRKEHAFKAKIGYQFMNGDIKFTLSNVLKFPVIAFIGGFACGSLGIGVGMIFNPILMETGLHP
jgi:hypothetical protein